MIGVILQKPFIQVVEDAFILFHDEKRCPIQRPQIQIKSTQDSFVKICCNRGEASYAFFGKCWRNFSDAYWFISDFLLCFFIEGIFTFFADEFSIKPFLRLNTQILHHSGKDDNHPITSIRCLIAYGCICSSFA